MSDEESVDLESDQHGMLSGEPKDMRVVNAYEKQNLLEFNFNFVNRSYSFCLFLFVALGIAVFSLLYIGIFEKSILAETFIISVIGTIYFILLVIMVVCGREQMLRSPLILFVSFFIGITIGFLVGVNLNQVLAHIDDDD